MTTFLNLLLLEDDDLDALVAQNLIRQFDVVQFNVRRCATLKETTHELALGDYAITLVDMNVPDSQGLDTIRSVMIADPAVPVAVLTGTDDTDIAEEALRMGVQDYLPKSCLDVATLQRLIQYSIRRKERDNELTAKAYYDTLTGLGNRALLNDRWHVGHARARRDQRCVGVIVIDVDNFKTVNDTYGHDVGDALLRDLAGSLKQAVRATDIVARIGGDEFVIVLENVRSLSDVTSVGDKIRETARKVTTQNGEAIDYAISVGGACCDPTETTDLISVLREADQEMYKCKARHKNDDGQEGEPLKTASA